MVIVTVSLTAGYIYKELKKKRIMNTALREKEVIMENFQREFNERWRRASNIRKIKTKKRIKEMFGIKTKYKQ
jgi:hypothetical protein